MPGALDFNDYLFLFLWWFFPILYHSKGQFSFSGISEEVLLLGLGVVVS